MKLLLRIGDVGNQYESQEIMLNQKPVHKRQSAPRARPVCRLYYLGGLREPSTLSAMLTAVRYRTCGVGCLLNVNTHFLCRVAKSLDIPIVQYTTNSADTEIEQFETVPILV